MRHAVTTVTTVITVAAGAFAPGHLGELTRIVPFELADAVLAEEGGRERRVRFLPSRCGLYFLLAMCLFPEPSCQGVWGKLAAGLRALGLPSPSGRALRDLRRRVGAAPVKRLFEVLAGPLGQPRTPGIMFGGYRTVSFDGCRSLRVPDTAANRAWLGKHSLGRSEAGYPALLLMTLVETGTRALVGAVFGSQADGEAAWARKLLPLLDASMLLLTDQGFDDGPFLAAVAAQGAQFLARLPSARKPRVLRHLPDGSYLTVISGVKVRHGDRLDQWITAVEADDQPDLHSFARGLRQDHAAVLNGLTLPWNSGIVEGNVNRLLRRSNDRCTAAPPSRS